MKKTKKILSVLMAFAMVMSFVVLPVGAEGEAPIILSAGLLWQKPEEVQYSATTTDVDTGVTPVADERLIIEFEMEHVLNQNSSTVHYRGNQNYCAIYFAADNKARTNNAGASGYSLDSHAGPNGIGIIVGGTTLTAGYHKVTGVVSVDRTKVDWYVDGVHQFQANASGQAASYANSNNIKFRIDYGISKIKNIKVGKYMPSPFVDTVSISGDAIEGQFLTANAVVDANNSGIACEPTYEWFRSENNSTWTTTGVTTSTYQVLPTDKYIRVQAKPYDGTNYYTAKDSASVEVIRPVVSEINIEGELKTGKILVALATIDDNGSGITNTEPVYQWHASADNSSWAPIVGETSFAYLTKSTDKFLKVEVKPKNKDNGTVYGGTFSTVLEIESSEAPVVTIPDVEILGNAVAGATLKLSGPSVLENSQIMWKSGSDEAGPYATIPAVESKEWKVTDAYANKYIKAFVSNDAGSTWDESAAIKIANLSSSISTLSRPAGLVDGTGPAAYRFKAGEQEYILLDKKVVDGKAEYLIYCADSIGIMAFDPDNTQRIDTEDINNIGYHLSKTLVSNTDGTFAQGIKDYAIEKEWVTPKGFDSYCNTGAFSVNSKLMIFSIDEYLEYVETGRLGVDDLYISASGAWLRNPNNTTSMVHRVMEYGAEGGVPEDQKAHGTIRSMFPVDAFPELHPIAWVSEDFFKNVKLTNIGNEIKNIIRSLSTREDLADTYTASELVEIGYGENTPKAEGVVVAGDIAVGSTVVAEYVFNANGSALTDSGAPKVQWYKADSSSATPVKISGATSTSYTIGVEDLGKLLMVEVTPIDNNGTMCDSAKSAFSVAVSSAETMSAAVNGSIYTDATGAPIDTVEGAKKVKTFITLKNDTGAPVSVNAVVALYDENNMLVEETPVVIPVPAGESTISPEITLTNPAQSGDYCVTYVTLPDNTPLVATGANIQVKFAESDAINVLEEIHNGKFTVQGKVEEAAYNQLVNVIVKDELSNVVHSAVVRTDNTGRVNHSFVLEGGTTGTHTIELYARGMSTPDTTTFEYASTSDRTVGLSTINTNVTLFKTPGGASEAAAVAALKAYISTNADVIGASNTYYSSNADLQDEIIKLTLKEAAAGGFATLADFEEQFTKNSALKAIKKSNQAGVQAIVETFGTELGVSSSPVNVLFEGLSSKNMVYGRLAGKDLADVSAFGTEFKNAVLLEVIDQATAWGDVAAILTNYQAQFPFSLTSYNLSMNTIAMNISGLNYVDMPALQLAISQIPTGDAPGGNPGGYISGVPGGAPGIVLPSATQNAFIDLASASWAADAINTLYDRGIVAGVDNQHFNPGASVTREAFVRMIVNAFGLKVQSGSNVFLDLNDDHWAYKEIMIANKLEIVNGLSETRFGIGMNITRQDMMVICSKAAKAAGVDLSSVKEFADFKDFGSVSDYAKDAVKELVSAGYVSGFEDNTVKPQDTTTRAQAAYLIYRLMEGVNK